MQSIVAENAALKAEVERLRGVIEQHIDTCPFGHDIDPVEP